MAHDLNLGSRLVPKLLDASPVEESSSMLVLTLSSAWLDKYPLYIQLGQWDSTYPAALSPKKLNKTDPPRNDIPLALVLGDDEVLTGEMVSVPTKKELLAARVSR